jgi:hypothetical protein
MAGGTKVSKVTFQPTTSQFHPVSHLPSHAMNALTGEPYNGFIHVSQKKFLIVFHLLPLAGCVWKKQDLQQKSLGHLKTLNCFSFFEYNLQKSHRLSIQPLVR